MTVPSAFHGGTVSFADRSIFGLLPYGGATRFIQMIKPQSALTPYFQNRLNRVSCCGDIF
ncbi:hypothetical protein [Parapedobacter defluvii]|uniref:hypothetical protein n=1 Tax=Parapedobacter defluvii TaxID=2045106 RepID=UPI00166330F5|nr:hypothetical protein [Parapedobacter defluvii]